jgi:DNA helicase-2/ATP-dependent DNA helicase PcrA
MQRILETEVDVSVEKDQYILTGKIDLLMGGDGKLELLDFKSQPRPSDDDARLDSYYKQLCIYGHILEQRYGKRPDRLLLYWTAESKKQDALMVFPYYREVLEEAGTHFDQVVTRILAKDFTIKRPPEPKVCKECDFRLYCRHEGTIKFKEPHL